MLKVDGNKQYNQINKTKKIKTIYLFLFFPFLMIVTLNIVPLLMGVFYSFTDWNGYSKTYEFVGLNNYKYILNQDNLSIIINTLFYLISGVVQIVVGIYLASFVYFKKKYKAIFSFIFLLPIFINSVAISLIFINFFEPEGILNTLLNQPDILWLGNKELVKFSLAFVAFWRYTSFSFILIYIGFLSIDKDIIKSAKIQGASNSTITKDILLPNIKTTQIIVFTMVIIGSFTAYEIPLVMTGGQNYTKTFLIRINELAFSSRNYGAASALTIMLVFIIMVLIILIQKYWRRDE